MNKVSQNFFNDVRRKINSLRFSTNISFRYVEIVHSRRNGEYLSLEFNTKYKLKASEEYMMEDLLCKSFNCHVAESLWTHRNKIFLIYFKLEDIDFNRIQDFSNFSNDNQTNTVRRRVKSEKKKAYDTRRAQEYQRKVEESRLIRERETLQPKWSLSEPSPSVKSVRSLWDSIERLGSPDGLTNSERAINEKFNERFQSFSEDLQSCNMRLDEYQAIASTCSVRLEEQSKAITELMSAINVNNKMILQQNQKMEEYFRNISENPVYSKQENILNSDVKTGTAGEQDTVKPYDKAAFMKSEVANRKRGNNNINKRRSKPRSDPEDARKLLNELERNCHLITDRGMMDDLLEAASCGDKKRFYAIIDNA